MGGASSVFDDHKYLVQDCHAISNDSKLILPTVDSYGHDYHQQQAVLSTSEGQVESKVRLVHHKDIGVPLNGLWEFTTALDVRCCYDHGIETLLHYEPRWMHLSDFRESNVKAYLDRLIRAPNDVTTTIGRNPAADSESNLLARVAFVSQRVDWNGSDIYLVYWKPTWTQLEFVHQYDGCIYKQVKKNRNGRLRWSKRIQKNAQQLLKRNEELVRLFNAI